MALKVFCMWAVAALALIVFPAFLERRGLIPSWVAFWVPFIPLFFVLIDLRQRQMRGEKFGEEPLARPLWIFVRAIALAAGAIALVLFFLSSEGSRFEVAGMMVVTLVAMGIAHLLGWFPLHRARSESEVRD
jgi:hypothetical protein